MATYIAKMIDAQTGGEGTYEFQAGDDLFKKTADEIVDNFFAHVDKEIFFHHVDYEINGAMKNKEHKVVTSFGSFMPDWDTEIPFLVMISPKQ